jgi:hypothetical protein
VSVSTCEFDSRPVHSFKKPCKRKVCRAFIVFGCAGFGESRVWTNVDILGQFWPKTDIIPASVPASEKLIWMLN